MPSTAVSTSRSPRETWCTALRCLTNRKPARGERVFERRRAERAGWEPASEGIKMTMTSSFVSLNRRPSDRRKRSPRAVLLLVAAAIAFAAGFRAQQNPFLGKWNLTGTGADSAYVGWLEITQDADQLSGMFLNRGGAPAKLAAVKIENGELVFQGAARRGGPGPEGRARMQGPGLAGTITSAATTAAPARTIGFTGARPPVFPSSGANGPTP